MTELSREAIAAVDRSDMLGDVLAQPDQVEDALWRVESARVPRQDLPGGLVVAGMGGSAIGGDLAAAVIGERAQRPLRVARGYALEPWARPDALVLCASYSGDTEETLACYRAARELGTPRVAVTTGGALAEVAREDGVPVIGVPSGMQPRAAVVYMTVAALECASACGASPSLRGEVEAAAGTMRSLTELWGPAAGPESDGKAIATSLRGTIPVVYGAGRTAAVARRWKTQLNENALVPAFASELPEADHNEICGWKADSPLSAVFLDDDGLDSRLRQRIDVTADLVADAAAVRRVSARGESAVERVLSLVLLGDLVSVYLAVLEGVDPTPVEAIERLKQELG
jgi:glucose/mannose-6-phosphate isomerase